MRRRGIWRRAAAFSRKSGLKAGGWGLEPTAARPSRYRGTRVAFAGAGGARQRLRCCDHHRRPGNNLVSIGHRPPREPNLGDYNRNLRHPSHNLGSSRPQPSLGPGDCDLGRSGHDHSKGTQPWSLPAVTQFVTTALPTTSVGGGNGIDRSHRQSPTMTSAAVATTSATAVITASATSSAGPAACGRGFDGSDHGLRVGRWTAAVTAAAAAAPALAISSAARAGRGNLTSAATVVRRSSHDFNRGHCSHDHDIDLRDLDLNRGTPRLSPRGGAGLTRPRLRPHPR